MSSDAPIPQHRPVALVTGAGSGIGRASSLALAHAGFDLLLVGRRREPLESVAAQARSTSAVAHVHPADVADPSVAESVIRSALDRFGRLDCLVNNAGRAPLLPIAQTTPDILRETFAVNALGPGALIVAAWPVFVAQRAGCVIGISTMGTADPFPGFFAYAAAKSAINSFARSVAKEGAPHNIKGFALAPGAVETPMLRALFDEAALPPGATLAPEVIATIVIECATGARDTQNGATIFIPSPG